MTELAYPVDRSGGKQLLNFPQTISQEKIANLGHVARPQVQRVSPN
jgi:hypothetical protein